MNSSNSILLMKINKYPGNNLAALSNFQLILFIEKNISIQEAALWDGTGYLLLCRPGKDPTL